MTLDELQAILDASKRYDGQLNDRMSRPLDQAFLQLVPKMKCADGFEMSVQASSGHYCGPRDSIGPWTEVEVGFPSEKVEALMPYIDGDETTEPTQTVYGYVPVKVIVDVINEHGGLAA